MVELSPQILESKEKATTTFMYGNELQCQIQLVGKPPMSKKKKKKKNQQKKTKHFFVQQ